MRIPLLARGSSRKIALIATLITFFFSRSLTSGISNFGPFELMVDGLSLPFVLLTTFSMPVVILSSWSSNKEPAYLACMLALESILLGFFTCTDVLSFYVFFEAVLIPLFLIVGVWGADGKVRASFLLFLYTLFGSLLMLLGLLYLGSMSNTYYFNLLNVFDIKVPSQNIIWLAIFLARAIKTPLMPFTGWLTRAHAMAPVGGSFVLAGLILKLATYGFLRLMLGVLPQSSYEFGPFVMTICVITLIYASAATLRQIDFKVLVAYSSVCHMAIGLAATFSNTIEGLQGAVIMGLAHGFVSPALFFIVGGIIYDRFHKREMNYFSGLTTYMPIAMLLFFLFALANASTPPSLNWVGELMCLTGTLERSPLITVGLATSIITSAGYSFRLFSRLAFGTYSPYLSAGTTDVSKREFSVLISLLIPTVFLGVSPALILNGSCSEALQLLLVS